jgi:hypothetical protein
MSKYFDYLISFLLWLLSTGIRIFYFAFRNQHVFILRRQIKRSKNEDKENQVATYSFWEVSMSPHGHSSQ